MKKRFRLPFHFIYHPWMTEAGSLALGLGLAFGARKALLAFDQHLLTLLPVALRLASMVLGHWLLALIPSVLIALQKETFLSYGIQREKTASQLWTGLYLGLYLSLVLTLVPLLLGYGRYLTAPRYRENWQMACNGVYCIFAVALAEEFLFRGFVFEKLRRLCRFDILALAGSSVLYGLFYWMTTGIPAQALWAGCLGALFCLCRLKVKNCTLLSLILFHGFYQALIPVWIAVFGR